MKGLYQSAGHPDEISKDLMTMEGYCPRCGVRIRIPVNAHEHFVEIWKAKAEYWREANARLIGDVNELMKYCQTHYGFNPAVDQLMDMLDEIRKKANDREKDDI